MIRCHQGMGGYLSELTSNEITGWRTRSEYAGVNYQRAIEVLLKLSAE